MRLNCSVRRSSFSVSPRSRARATAYDYESSRASLGSGFLLEAKRFNFFGRVRIRMFDCIWRQIIFMPQSTAVTGWLTGSRAHLVGADALEMLVSLLCLAAVCCTCTGGRKGNGPTLQRMVCPVLGGE
jgi:hypothetical protein